METLEQKFLIEDFAPACDIMYNYVPFVNCSKLLSTLPKCLVLICLLL